MSSRKSGNSILYSVTNSKNVSCVTYSGFDMCNYLVIRWLPYLAKCTAWYIGLNTSLRTRSWKVKFTSELRCTKLNLEIILAPPVCCWLFRCPNYSSQTCERSRWLAYFLQNPSPCTIWKLYMLTKIPTCVVCSCWSTKIGKYGSISANITTILLPIHNIKLIKFNFTIDYYADPLSLEMTCTRARLHCDWDASKTRATLVKTW